ncbi:MAG: hypothetical protein IAE77_05900 [Prosthecobacter sp.]|uniref:DUF6883 domain-containing protein n=1 Tax=Prosthecobacter sp. TaxID=1965333 RepID=UPI0019F0EBAF|nr:DUF6883 domain-containing protein [Prosthecobacter sp.]MBE2282973.1 hypothetical protein [Prosthecobacter sp.]
MYLPADAIIAPEKLHKYLLVPLPRGDKSRYLAIAGYSLNAPARLEADIRSQILPLEATPDGATAFGDMFVICGSLVGPNGRTLQVRTVWIKEALSGQVKFVTLYPHS